MIRASAGHDAIHGGCLGQDDLTVLVTDRFTVEEVQLDTVIVSTLTVEEAESEDSGSYR